MTFLTSDPLELFRRHDDNPTPQGFELPQDGERRLQRGRHRSTKARPCSSCASRCETGCPIWRWRPRPQRTHQLGAPTRDRRDAPRPGQLRRAMGHRRPPYHADRGRLHDRVHRLLRSADRSCVSRPHATSVTFDRRGILMSPDDKDAALFPATFDDRWALRPPTHTRNVEPRDPRLALVEPRPASHWGDASVLIPARRRGGWWDANKVGLGPPPMLTDEGWLHLLSRRHASRRPVRSIASVWRYSTATTPTRCLFEATSGCSVRKRRTNGAATCPTWCFHAAGCCGTTTTPSTCTTARPIHRVPRHRESARPPRSPALAPDRGRTAPVDRWRRIDGRRILTGRRDTPRQGRARSLRICWLARRPGPPVTQPPGWVPLPHW